MADFSWCGLDVSFKDGISVSYNESGECDDCRHVTIDEFRTYLLNGDLKYPKVIYTRIAGAGLKDDKKQWKKYRHDMLLLSLGVAGVEYVKTEGWKYVSDGKDVPVLVQTVMGSVTVLLQKNARSFRVKGILGDEEWFVAEKIYAVRVPRGRKVVIPPGYYVVFVNNTLNPAAVSIVVDKDAKEEAAPFSESRGAAYYAIKKNARQELVPNPLYRAVNPLSKVKPDKIWELSRKQEDDALAYTALQSKIRRFHSLINELACWDTELCSR